MRSTDQYANPSLSTVTDNFAQWRESGVSRQKTPKALQEQTLGLLAHYPKSQIIKSLNIPHSSLKNWITREKNDDPVNLAPNPHDEGFISLPPESLAPMVEDADSAALSSMTTLSICLSNGHYTDDFTAFEYALGAYKSIPINATGAIRHE
jgi:hypothetical protein